MATPEITFFPVGNGDMTLIKLSNGQTILIDVNIRQPGDGVRDVLKDLHDKLSEDEEGRPYVDVMVLSHPDQDHCRGLVEHFHLGPLMDYPVKGAASKIVIREMWSSPLVYRRASTSHTLSDDAKAWNKEAKRRVAVFKDEGAFDDGDRILIMGEDTGGKTDDILDIVIKAGERITAVAGKSYENFSALLLAPLNAESEDDAEQLTKNESSVIINYSIGTGAVPDAVKFLSAGDAEVYIWDKKLWPRYKDDKKALEYDLLSTPHHCSWHTLSYHSWSEKREEAEVCENARSALSQARPGAYIVASSNKIVDDKNDPPCIRAKREYESVAKDANGTFLNTAVHPTEKDPEPMTFEVMSGGVKLKWKASAAKAAAGAATVLGSQPLSHGKG
ncbi:metallohydrolase [Burkholderia multivorans]|uniref:metallohydrolase n=1 Tax=Burkholderia multivorans TaxID=87883 RepID=UPI0013DF2624|nr:metallohydrolase [Burkholderia multivorans]MBU9618963.1 metallohydrolase [Burkholderia multivorans]NGM76431.1 metallohydrolase [Burkholderia multivorans]